MATTILTEQEGVYKGALSTAIASTGAITPTVSPTPKNQTGYIKVVRTDDSSYSEIMKFTANAAGVLTITAANRGLCDTTARNDHSIGLTVIMPWTKEAVEEIDTYLESLPTKTWVSANYGAGIAGVSSVSSDGGAGQTGAIDFIGGTNITLTDNADGTFDIDASIGVTGYKIDTGILRTGLLDLLAGTNMTLTDNGNGTVTVDADTQTPTSTGCKLIKLNSQTGITTNEDVTWDSEEYDTDSFWSTGATIRIPAGLGGKYLVSGNIEINVEDSGTVGTYKLEINDTSVAYDSNVFMVAGNSILIVSFSIVLNRNATQPIVLTASALGGTTIDINSSEISVTRLGA